MATPTYGKNLAGSSKDRLRFMLGDTNMTSPLLQDEEITAQLTLSGGGIYTAAAELARALALRFAREVDTADEGTSANLSQRSKQFEALAEKYEKRAVQAGEVSLTAGTVTPVEPYVGGVSLGEIAGVDRDPDRPASFSSARGFALPCRWWR